MRFSGTQLFAALGLAGWIGLGGVTRTGSPWAPVEADSAARARALHLLNRITYGPRPGDVDRVVAMGTDRFIDEQLHPERIADRELTTRLERFRVLRTSDAELARIFAEVQRENLQRQRQMAVASDSAGAMRPGPDPGMQRERMAQGPGNEFRRLLGEYQTVVVTRAVLSERQLTEVLVDFWTNHFNVFIGKGPVRTLVPGYVENTIRPHTWGKFEDLLIATAKSPAMLLYLDNAQSVTPGAEPPQLARLRQVQRRRPLLGARAPRRAQLDSMMARAEQRLPRGINENYARELMELHTLGVDGGYTQADVQQVARILTGWSVGRPRQAPEFVFNDWAHDRREKVVLGWRFPAGGDQGEGLELLRRLARHPSTMRHVSGKLCARFVSDHVPDGCVDAGVHAWERSGGDIREVVGAILQSRDFWAPENRGTKIKTPFEFVVSAVRALNAQPDSTPGLAMLVGRLGQPLFGQQPPTGYPETQESWVNSGALLRRMNVAMGLAGGRMPGARADVDQVVPVSPDRWGMIASANRAILNGSASVNTLRTMENQVNDLEPRTARAMIVGLALGSPEFQRQ